MTLSTFSAAASLSSAALLAASSVSSSPTYTRDVAKILNNHCVECHRAGEIAPMAFTSYKEVRPWAKAIRESVTTGVMPPWLADPAHGQFKNDRRLSKGEIETLSAWVSAGAPEGAPKDLPPAPPFETGWNIGKPDQIFDIGTDYAVPPEGTVAYQYFKVPTNFTEDKWIQAAEIRADKRDVVHHVIVFIQEPGAKGMGAVSGEGGSLLDRSYIGVKYAAEPPGYRSLFNWQLSYELKEPVKLPKGTRNPDPTKEVKWGDQTWQEMMIGWFSYRVPVQPPQQARLLQ